MVLLVFYTVVIIIIIIVIVIIIIVVVIISSSFCIGINVYASIHNNAYQYISSGRYYRRRRTHRQAHHEGWSLLLEVQGITTNWKLKNIFLD